MCIFLFLNPLVQKDNAVVVPVPVSSKRYLVVARTKT